ncbi:MAG: hypothetical protein WC312_03730 [Candidatus Omnitrophota bacterium]
MPKKNRRLSCRIDNCLHEIVKKFCQDVRNETKYCFISDAEAIRNYLKIIERTTEYRRALNKVSQAVRLLKATQIAEAKKRA